MHLIHSAAIKSPSKLTPDFHSHHTPTHAYDPVLNDDFLRDMMHADFLLIMLNDTILNGLLEHIDLRARELPGADAALEEQIELSKGAALGFGNAVVSIDDAKEADAAPEEAGVVSPSSRRWG